MAPEGYVAVSNPQKTASQKQNRGAALAFFWCRPGQGWFLGCKGPLLTHAQAFIQQNSQLKAVGSGICQSDSGEKEL